MTVHDGDVELVVENTEKADIVLLKLMTGKPASLGGFKED
jgi:hypothetical protein